MLTKPMTFSLLLAALLASAAAPAIAEDLTVVSTGGTIQDNYREVMWKPFAAQEKINLIEDTIDYGIGVVRTKIQAGSTWDVIEVEDIDAIQGCDEGFFTKIEWSKIAAKSSLLPFGVLPCGMASAVSSTVVVYDGNRIKDGPKSWAEFWDVTKWPGKRGLAKDPRDNLELALMADGVAPNEVYKVLATPAGVDRAFHKLDELKPNVIWFTNPGQARQMVVNGDASMIASYLGGALTLNRREHTNFKFGMTGKIIQTDYWVISHTTKHLALAEKYLDYVGRADKEAEFGARQMIGVANQDAYGLVDPALRQYVEIDQSDTKNSVVSNATFWLEYDDQLNQRFIAWAAQ
jgi:putative spermidine/putrescine transport system substrate-binding protein